MRFPLLVGLSILCASSCLADRLISIPLGRKIPFEMFRFETFAEVSRARTLDRYLAIGVTPDFEFDLHEERIGGGSLRDTFDFSYNYVAPITNTAPGFNIGVMDALNKTRDGRRAYIAMTYRDGLDGVMNGNVPLEVTLGIAQGSRTLPFLGVMLPMQPNFRFLVEDNGFRVATGFEIRALANKFSAKLLFRDQDTMLGASLTMRF